MRLLRQDRRVVALARAQLPRRPQLLQRAVPHGAVDVLLEAKQHEAEHGVQVVAHRRRQDRLVDRRAVRSRLDPVLVAEARGVPCRSAAAVAAAAVGVHDPVVVAGMVARAEAVDAHSRVRVHLAHEAAVSDAAWLPHSTTHAVSRAVLVCEAVKEGGRIGAVGHDSEALGQRRLDGKLAVPQELAALLLDLPSHFPRCARGGLRPAERTAVEKQ